MAKRKENKERLRIWKERLTTSVTAYASVEADMDKREALYRGNREISPLTELDKSETGGKNEATHVRNIIAENIESEVDSAIPQPKVQARRKQDEPLAKLIEDMIRNELDRMPFETMNDQQERTVPIQGGGLFLVEWDNTKRSHTTVGEVAISLVHPKQVAPQDGVYTGIEDMDFMILKVPQTKEYIRRKYGVDLNDESESEPDIKTAVGAAPADDMVTQYVGFYRNDDGGIGLYSWVNDTQLEDLDDYQARRLRRCVKCGALEPAETEPMDTPTLDGTWPGEPEQVPEEGQMPENMPPERSRPAGKKGACPYCGSTQFKDSVEDFEELYVEHTTASGKVIPGAVSVLDQNGEVIMKPTRIPFYKPDVYPVVLQKNVSVYGQFLGDSDVDKIADQQNTVNRLAKKIIDRLIKAGTRITLPDRADFRIDPKDGEKWLIGNPIDKSLIDVYEFSGDLQYEMLFYNQVYEEARQELGITDSFQGRRDNTATSGVAKEFAAAQAAGRMESKRVMKDAAYAQIFELIFKFILAYADEPRNVVAKDTKGDTKYETFDRYDFLEQDAAGEWYWNDQFLFSCDTSAPLASNRPAMWQENTASLQNGAYGDPTQIDTLILYWTKMELLHYPGASETKAYLEEKLKQQQEAQRQAELAAQQEALRQQQLAQNQTTPTGGQAQQKASQAAGQEVVRAVEEQARQDAQAAVQGQQTQI